MKSFSKLVIAALSLLSVKAIQQQADIYYHEKPVLGASMWHFSPDGLSIFSPSGDILKEHSKNVLCPKYSSWDGTESEDCYYYTWASDGHEYVWAGSMAGDHVVQVFDIDTGDYAGYIDTCSTPLDLEYHPVRKEMYLRCAQEDTAGGNPGEIDVFTSASLSVDLPMVKFNATTRPYGRLAIHSSMGPIGYSLAYDQNYITEMDLSSKSVAATYVIPDAYGGYDTTYSPINQHLYFRSRVCCTCNSTDADVESCGRGPGTPVLVTTGPSKSDVEQIGVCSGGCEGSSADTIGVVEFDTVNKDFVDNHNILEGTGWGADPVASPDGKWIVLLPNDGGQYVRVLEAGKNGESSGSVVRDVAVDFKGGSPGKTVVSDVAFIQDGDREILIVGANTDNYVVLVDLNSDSFETQKLNISPMAAESTGGGERAVEWAVGTDYVWVDGGEAEEVYILKIPQGIKSATVDRTLTDLAGGNILFVNNYERLRAATASHGSIPSASSSVSMMSQDGANTESSSSNSNTLSVVGIILGAIGFIAGVGALIMVNQLKSASTLAAVVTDGNNLETKQFDNDL